MTIKDQLKMYAIWIQCEEWQKNKKQESSKFIRKISELLTLWGDMEIKRNLRKYGGLKKEFDEEIKQFDEEALPKDSPFNFIISNFQWLKNFTLELLKETNELNVIEMDERVMALIQSHYDLIIKDLNRSLMKIESIGKNE